MDSTCHLISMTAMDGAKKVTIGLRSAPPFFKSQGKTRFDVLNVWMMPVSSVPHLVEKVVSFLDDGRELVVYDPLTGRALYLTRYEMPCSIESVKDGWSAPCFLGNEYHNQYHNQNCTESATHATPWSKPNAAPSCCAAHYAKFMSKPPYNGEPVENQQVILIGPLPTPKERT